MQLLVLTNNPDRASFRQRVSVYRDILADRGIRTEIAVLPKGTLARRKLFRQARHFDGVFIHKKKLNLFDAFELRRHSRKIIYSFDDAVMLDPAHPESNSRAHYVPFRRTVRLADMVIAGSGYLAEWARPFNADVHVLPIGLDTRDYGIQEALPQDDSVRLVWIGSRSTLNYLRLIDPVLDRLAARFTHAALRVIGDEFPSAGRMPVETIPWSPQARRLGLATADIGLAPLPDDPFTRGKCSFKVLEYSASGLPVVASPVGTNAEYVLDGTTGYLAKEETDWFERLAHLVEDGELRARMGRAGRERAAEFDIEGIGVRFALLLGRCLQGGASDASRFG
jgi:glycosyltransferase involved in cell wall biosynthesis